ICTRIGRDVAIKVLDHDDGLPDLIIKKIDFLNADTVGFATEDKGILKYCVKTGKIAPLTGSQWDGRGISDFVVKENQVWIAIPRQGLFVFDRRLNGLKKYGGPAATSASTLLKDQEGNIWIGRKTGLSRTIGDAIELVEDLNPSGDLNVLALTIDLDDQIWFSTRDGLFCRIVHRDGSTINVPKLTSTPFDN